MVQSRNPNSCFHQKVAKSIFKAVGLWHVGLVLIMHSKPAAVALAPRLLCASAMQ